MDVSCIIHPPSSALVLALLARLVRPAMSADARVARFVREKVFIAKAFV